MSIIHNRTSGAAIVALAFAVVLLGAGCSKAKPESSANDIPLPDAATTPATDASSGLPTKWAEYRSEKLGITIPYPEGWYVEEQSDGSTDFFQHAPPEYSDAPSQMWILKRESNGVDAAIQAEFPTVYERGEVTRSGIAMTRIVYPYDVRLDPDKRMVAYVWARADEVHMIGGAESDANLEYAVDRLEVNDE